MIKKITFRDTEYRTSRGQKDLTNFGIRGCCFHPTGAYVYILASKACYRSYVIKYSISSRTVSKSHTIFDFEPIRVTEVHTNATSKMLLSKNGQIAAIGTSDGFIKLFDLAENKVILS